MDLGSLSPVDAAVALRSLPRRFGAALAPVEADAEGHDDEWTAGDGSDVRVDDLAHRAGADGWSALDHVVAVERALGLVLAALRTTLVADEPVLDASVLDGESPGGPGLGGDLPLDRALALLGDQAANLAEAVEHVPPSDWDRRARVEGRDEPVTALDLVREAVRTGVTHLRAAERVVDEARGRP